MAPVEYLPGEIMDRKPIDKLREELLEYKDTLRRNLLEFTRKAFEILPGMASPRILDIGCGSGVPTLELARMSGGHVTGIDTDQVQLARLKKKIKNAGLSGRVEAINCSMLSLGFPEGSFDIIWAEGAIAAIGFERGIREWRRLLKVGGYLVVHDGLGGLKEKLELIPRCRYELISHFVISEDIWWSEYYAPLNKKLDEISSKHGNDKRIVEMLSGDRQEADGFEKDNERYRSVFFILRKM
jgi:ubiquinone/menaquinone biosynthesis C-methylase UbiE